MIFCYQEKKFREKSLELIRVCNQVIDEHRQQGYELTLRQLYYQLVGLNLIPNNEKSYDNIGALVSDARLAGLIDWDAIEDRTRGLRGRSHWGHPSEIVRSAARGYNIDLWEGQPTRVEVWVEKDALRQVVGIPASEYDVPYFSCKGYTSQTAMWDAAQRIIAYYEVFRATSVVILHFGDHDPSGIDMTRDIEDRLRLFCEAHGQPGPIIRRLALNMDQVRRYKLPPNPAKLSDCRAGKYIAEYGRNSWELDAMKPKAIDELVTESILDHVDLDLFEARKAEEKAGREGLLKISDNYTAVVEFVKGKK